VVWVNVTVWQVGAGLRCVPRCQQRYVVASDQGDADAWAVWRETGSGGAELVDSHVGMELTTGDNVNAKAEKAARADGAEAADVLRLGSPERPGTVGRAAALVDRALIRYPGCLVALVPEAKAGGCVAGTRNGTRVLAVPVAGSPRLMTGPECAGFASFLHSQLVVGQGWTAERGSVVLAIQPVRTTTGRRAPLWIRMVSLTRA
jgi:hypothetical protein